MRKCARIVKLEYGQVACEVCNWDSLPIPMASENAQEWLDVILHDHNRSPMHEHGLATTDEVI